MRCTNCGWENPDGQQYCEKCNSPLSNNVGRNYAEAYSLRTVNENNAYQELRATVRERNEEGITCPNCGYPLLPDMPVCPNCGHTEHAAHLQVTPKRICPKCNHENQEGGLYCSHCGFSLQPEPKRPARPVFGRKTVTPWEIQANAPTCTLTPIPNNPEEAPLTALSFSGEEITLNRDNTEAGNMTITSKEQAALIFEEGKWYLQDRSEHQTTFVYRADQIELQAGDIIVLGNRRFEFNGQSEQTK